MSIDKKIDAYEAKNSAYKLLRQTQEKLRCGIKKTSASEPCTGSVYFSDEDQCLVCDTCDFCENDNQGN